MSSSTNSTTEVPNFNLPEKKPTAEEQSFLDDILKLYKLNPVSAAYAHYGPNAVFSDPISIAEGLESIKSQFNGMPRIFSESITKSVKVLDNPKVTPPSLQIALAQDYHFKLGGSKLVNSLITFHVDPKTNLITRHEEEWDGQNNATSADGFFGKMQELRKKATAKIVAAGVDSTPVDQQ